MPTQLSGQFDLSTATETVALASNTDVASFNDANTTDTASAFTATIDWGDGITTTGTVVGSNGSFQVQGGHTYADDGFFNPVATIVRTADNSTLVLQGGVGVADTDAIAGSGEPTIVANPNQALNNVTVATFTDSNTSNPASDFTVSIDWGDGTVTSGTLTGSNGSFAVTGSHTYTTAGNFTISTFMTDDSGQEDAAFGSAFTQAAIGFGGSETLHSATETVAIPTGTTVATFVDNAGLPSTDYIATIDWGDGVTTTGAVSGSNGSFAVTSTSAHTYADEGLDTALVTVTRTTDNAHATMSGTVAVADNDFLNASGTTVHGDPGVALNNVTVATFTDSNHVNGAGDFVASIDWGDGVTTTGTVSGSNGSFAVSGSHTYAQNGQDTIAVTVTEELDNPQSFAHASTNSTALIGLAPVAGETLSATEGTAIAAGTQVASFSDSNSSDTAASFTATIDWGDGVTTAGTVSGSNGSFTVTSFADHTYVDEGNDAVTTTLTRMADHTTATAVGTAVVDDADNVSVTADNISGNAGQSLNNVQVATFTTTYAANVASDFLAFIDWGDGTTTQGTISGSNGSFSVDGSHTYTNGGQDTFTVTVAEDTFSNPVQASGTATINLGGQMVLTSATEGTALPANTSVAIFSDSTAGDTAADFTATIDWGDGVTSAGTVVGSAGNFTVQGGHTYADEGITPDSQDFATVTLIRTADNSTASVTGPVTVGEGDNLTGTGLAVTPNVGQGFNGAVATFSDTDTVTAASDFTATIDWGDGTVTSGTVSGANGSFAVSGTHTYAAAGDFTVQVHGADDFPGTATFDTTGSAHVVFPIVGHMDLTSATEGTALPNNTDVATFIDGNLTDTASNFTATIDWGDGVTTNGTVVGSTGTFTVDGGHTYADEGHDTATVTLTRTSDHSQTTASGTVAVAEGDVLTPHNMNAAIVVNQPFSGQIGHFTDSDLANVAGDFTATIDWGDGATTSGTVSGSNGAFDVSGTHAYTTVGLHNVHVTLADDAPGTATATATAKIVFNHSNGHHASAADLSAESFLASDGTADPAGQTLGEVPANWDMIGTGQFSGPSTDTAINTDALFLSDTGGVVIWQTVNGNLTANQFVGQLPTDYHFAGIDDFNGDGKSDVLWHQDGGNVVMWEMNGTQVAVNQVVGQIPSNWHISGTADVNGDGMSDIIFTSDAGTQRVWEMNGTQVIADQPYDPNAPLATHVLDTHVTDATPPVVAPGPAPIVAGGLAGTLGGLSIHDAHFLV